MSITTAGPLVVRPVEPGDVDGLLGLYDRLSAEDRYRRFFSGFRPDRPFVEAEVARASGSGFELVVVTADGEVVAAAGWSALPDGDGELAITVDRRWRGWLGPYLLDALLRAAAARGIRNLQADVLVLNRPMLALVRSRGFVTMSHPDSSVVRIAIGASDAMPGWPRGDGPKVLVETPGGRWHAEDAAAAAGLRVLACSGPTGAGAGGPRGCPLERGEPCPLAAEADVIVVCGPRDDPAWDAVRSAHPRVHPGIPVVLEPRRGATPQPGERVVSGSDAEVAARLREISAEH